MAGKLRIGSAPRRSTTLGIGTPKIIVPLVARTQLELIGSAAQASGYRYPGTEGFTPAHGERHPSVGARATEPLTFTGTGGTPPGADDAESAPTFTPDLLEWRVDYMEEALSETAMLAAAQDLRTATDLPILATFRTSAEGGEKEIEGPVYADLLVALAESGAVDAVDVEMFRDSGLVEGIVAGIQGAGVPVIGSFHDFAETPNEAEILGRLTQMAQRGANAVKIATTANSKRDALTVLGATLAASQALPVPVISMAMGPAGAITRIATGIFGGSASFATIAAQATSAPGQLPAAELAPIMDYLARIDG
ncbi:type I 3-dehydroquinate dehydratase [Actinobaculum suis]|uniref:type I 3-dehydroquinate dehydratase n=1 Tax=Actinobaculum suis TaxID=1657 RepID=UPI0008086826|nr:type I 3-dehydroquinate dehydratase [Actinobaculum suis]OCA94624.1 type I 3-dehydroquinate dehydratase [Actinobaculum suis]OCA94936.1 type I 3-dehydroquinate dehydratase [Actinobaculum suis]